MFKKHIWRPILITLAWLITISGTVVLMSFINFKKAGVVCKDVKVYIPGSQYFIDKQSVDDILGVSNHALIGRKLENINLHDLEQKLKANPFIDHAKIYADMDGIINVEISQRQPILHIMNQFDQDFYVDRNGLKLPLSNNFTARVLAANGYIEEPFGKVDTLHTPLAKDIYKAADFITKDTLWNAQIAQIYVNQEHEMELIPRVGNQHILIGSADSLKNKMDNLLAFYKQAMPRVGWNTYQVINLKYANQVIGVKKGSMVKIDSTKTANNSIKADSLIKTTQDTSHIKN
ncbi:cell division protein FtsQ/DivIB [Mucilaginibacter ginkgonis]|uniref:Cell division protein FtsQ n=1 Tax=Mucilaginibacter ginkgonis TaxID=2682091 RepID=A0A6I4INH4_9SPHI|nr:cell division protein FtsQ [Mucilaginibacter ginkgonis]QQL48605.1 cell division protein FtsQ [Mucilaginibacter ginkgonis]